MKESGKQKIRIFIGISLSEEARDYAASKIDQLSRLITGVRWVRPENLHITLKFIGWCDSSVVPEIVKIMSQCSKFLPAKVSVGGVGGFPSHDRAKVIWVGAGDIEGKLEKMFRMIDGRLTRMGIKSEKRKYHPHITIGRSSGGPVAVPSISERENDSPIFFTVEDIILFESELKSSGAEYSVLQRIK